MRPSQMKHMMRPFGLLLVSLALAGCSSIPLIGSNSLEITIQGVELDEVVSLFVIVGAAEDLGDVDDQRTIEKVVLPERQSKYVTFAQFKPVKAKTWTLKQRVLQSANDKVEVSSEDDAPELTVEVDRDLLEPFPQLNVVVAVNCGALGWAAYPRIQSAEIGNVDELKLEVRGNRISLAGSTKAQKGGPVSVPK